MTQDELDAIRERSRDSYCGADAIKGWVIHCPAEADVIRLLAEVDALRTVLKAIMTRIVDRAVDDGLDLEGLERLQDRLKGGAGNATAPSVVGNLDILMGSR